MQGRMQGGCRTGDIATREDQQQQSTQQCVRRERMRVLRGC